jgi:hypothetical protein
MQTKLCKLACSPGTAPEKGACWRIKDISTYDQQAYGPTPFSPRDSQGSCQSAEQGGYKRLIYLNSLTTQTLTITKKPCDPWRYSHDVFRFRHRSHCIHDELSDFVIDSECWIWSPIWSPNTMTLCQFRHRFHHRSRCIHDNIQNLS